MNLIAIRPGLRFRRLTRESAQLVLMMACLTACVEGKTPPVYGPAGPSVLPPVELDDGGQTDDMNAPDAAVVHDLPSVIETPEPREPCREIGLECQTRCLETAAGPRCVCEPGFALKADGGSCMDVNECLQNNGGCPGACRNFDGGYECLCDAGFDQSLGGRDCFDIDECADNNGGCDGQCLNTPGGFECRCDPPSILAADGYSCSEPSVSGSVASTADRSIEAVCERWQSDVQTVRPEWSAGSDDDDCDPGATTEEALQNAVLRTNLYRWLAGLEWVILNRNQLAAQQECALMQGRSGHLNHRPTEDAPCYTPEGAEAAGKSNLARGSLDLATSVGLYIADIGVSSLGHRRWILNPSMSDTAFGIYRGSSCMHVIGQGVAHEVDYVTWPPAGFVPTPAVRGAFSFSNYRLRLIDDFAVRMSVNGADFEDLSFTALRPGYGRDNGSWSFNLRRGAWVDGNVITVRISGFEGGIIEYQVKPVGC